MKSWGSESSRQNIFFILNCLLFIIRHCMVTDTGTVSSQIQHQIQSVSSAYKPIPPATSLTKLKPSCYSNCLTGSARWPTMFGLPPHTLGSASHNPLACPQHSAFHKDQLTLQAKSTSTVPLPANPPPHTRPGCLFLLRTLHVLNEDSSWEAIF